MKIINLIHRIFKRGPKGPSLEERELPEVYLTGIERRHDGLLNDLGSAGLSDRQIRETLEAIEYWLEGPLIHVGESGDIALGWTSWKVTPLRRLEHDHQLSVLHELYDRVGNTAARMYTKEGLNDPL